MRIKHFVWFVGLMIFILMGVVVASADSGLRPNLTISPSIAPLNPATTLTIMGSGFPQGQEVLILFVDTLGVPTGLPIVPVSNEQGGWAVTWKLGEYVAEKKIVEGVLTVTASDTEYNTLASAPVGLVDNTKNPKKWPDWATAAGIEPAKKVGPITANATVTKAEDEGRLITFQTEKGDIVISKLSSSRSKIKKGNRSLQRGDIKEGMKITITYLADGDRNEPSQINILE